MSDTSLEALQAEIEALRRKSARRSIKQVLKDGRDKVSKTMNKIYFFETFEEGVIQVSVICFFVLLAILIPGALIFSAIATKGLTLLTLLLIPIYPLYLIFRKPQ